MVPLVPGLYKIHYNVNTDMPLTQDCPVPLIDSPPGHYTNTGMHSSSLWLALSRQRTARESSGTHLCSTHRHECTLPQKCLHITSHQPYACLHLSHKSSVPLTPIVLCTSTWLWSPLAPELCDPPNKAGPLLLAPLGDVQETAG